MIKTCFYDKYLRKQSCCCFTQHDSKINPDIKNDWNRQQMRLFLHHFLFSPAVHEQNTWIWCRKEQKFSLEGWNSEICSAVCVKTLKAAGFSWFESLAGLTVKPWRFKSGHPERQTGQIRWSVSLPHPLPPQGRPETTDCPGSDPFYLAARPKSTNRPKNRLFLSFRTIK